MENCSGRPMSPMGRSGLSQVNHKLMDKSTGNGKLNGLTQTAIGQLKRKLIDGTFEIGKNQTSQISNVGLTYHYWVGC